MSNVWIVRAGRNAAYVDTFLDHSLVAIGFAPELGSQVLSLGRKELAQEIAVLHSDWPLGKINSATSQLYRFLADVAVGDTVATYDHQLRRYLIGSVSSEPKYRVEPLESLPFTRDVGWSRKASRDSLSVGTRNSLGAIQTIFRLNDEASDELQKLAIPLDAEHEVDAETQAVETESSLEDLKDEVVEKAAEFVEDILARLDPYEMQDVVAGLLRAMGYKTRVSSPGADRGTDIFASPDGLGLQEPRIFVEVKHRRTTAMGSQDLRAFIGGRQPGDRCLYVSTGGFTKDARYEAERSSIPLTLLGLPELRALVLEHYEALDVETRRLVPLTKLYWPIAEG